MRFEEAIEAMRKGDAITRPCYDVYFVMKNNKISYKHKFIDKYSFSDELKVIATIDIVAEDWEVINIKDCQNEALSHKNRKIENELLICRAWLEDMIGMMNNEEGVYNKGRPIGAFEYKMKELLHGIDEVIQ